MRYASRLREVRDALLALSDPDLLLLLQQWIEDTTQTVEEQMEDLLCLRLGYTIHASRQYPSFTAYIEAEDDDIATLYPPPPQELRVRLAALSMNDFNRIVIACAFSVSRPRGTHSFEQPTGDELTWLAQAIRENTSLDRGRPRCLFYCFGYQLGLRAADTEQDALPLLRQTWKKYMTGLLWRLWLFPETEKELEALFLFYAALGLRDGRKSIALNSGLEIMLLLFQHTPELALLAPAMTERYPLSGTPLEQTLRHVLWDRAPFSFWGIEGQNY